jgi:hypothetical protein
MMTVRMLPVDKAPLVCSPAGRREKWECAWVPPSEGLVVDVRFMSLSHFAEPRLFTREGGI